MWDTPEAQQVVKKRLDFVLSGCGCKTGCNTKRCKCFKQGQGCGPGCRCVGCINPVSTQSENLEREEMEEDASNEEVVTTWQDLHNLEVQDMIHSHDIEAFVDNDSDSDSEPIKEDEELDKLMMNVFGDGFDDGGSDSDENDIQPDST